MRSPEKMIEASARPGWEVRSEAPYELKRLIACGHEIVVCYARPIGGKSIAIDANDRVTSYGLSGPSLAIASAHIRRVRDRLMEMAEAELDDEEATAGSVTSSGSIDAAEWARRVDVCRLATAGKNADDAADAYTRHILSGWWGRQRPGAVTLASTPGQASDPPWYMRSQIVPEGARVIGTYTHGDKAGVIVELERVRALPPEAVCPPERAFRIDPADLAKAARPSGAMLSDIGRTLTMEQAANPAKCLAALPPGHIVTSIDIPAMQNLIAAATRDNPGKAVAIALPPEIVTTTPAVPCPDCNGSKRYRSLLVDEPCRTCCPEVSP
jgi:hypothetical protein